MGRVTIIQEGVCLKSDNELIFVSLMARCRQLERVLENRPLTPNERVAMQDEYERTFALTAQYKTTRPRKNQ